jgi:hypothetical protein
VIARDQGRRDVTIEDPIDIKRGSAAARRGLDKVDHAYDDLRLQANLLLDEIRSKLA